MSRVARMAEVIQFPKDPYGSSSKAGYSVDLLDSIFQDPRLDERIQERIEGQLLAQVYRARIGALREIEDSFDDIYLSELLPDSFKSRTTADIRQFKSVRDLSAEISFLDEWED